MRRKMPPLKGRWRKAPEGFSWRQYRYCNPSVTFGDSCGSRSRPKGAAAHAPKNASLKGEVAQSAGGVLLAAEPARV